jgi:hypothetical protein
MSWIRIAVTVFIVDQRVGELSSCKIVRLGNLVLVVVMM